LKRQKNIQEQAKEYPRTKGIFTHFKEPWFFLETADEYRGLFEKYRFRIVLSKIGSIRTKHTPEEVFNIYTPEEVFNIFSSGAVAGYLSQDFYDVEINTDYTDSLKD